MRKKQRFLAAERLKKYLVYAFGEIALIVLGILIALEVNNWNLDRIQRKEEVAILKELLQCFRTDSVTLTYQIVLLQENTEHIDQVLNTVIKGTKNLDSVDYHYFANIVTPFFWSECKSAYQTLTAKGVDIIDNNDIRKEVLLFHSQLYETIHFAERGVYLNHNQITEISLPHFDIVGGERVDKDGSITYGRMIPHDISQLRNDTKFASGVRTVLSQKKVQLILLSHTKERLNLIINMIEMELEKRGIKK